MNLTTPQPEGRTVTGDMHLDLIAACLPANLATAHWACGLPLSFVQEMADRWLSQHDNSARLSAPLDAASNRSDNPSADSE